MFSIKLPGMPAERTVPTPVWTPEISDEEVKKIENLTILEEMYNHLQTKIEKLGESNQALKECIKEEREGRLSTAQAGKAPEGAAQEVESAEGHTDKSDSPAKDTVLHDAADSAPATAPEVKAKPLTTDDALFQEAIAQAREAEKKKTAVETSSSSDAHVDSYAADEEHYELVSAVFENCSIMDQMSVRLKFLKERIDKIQYQGGMSL